MTLYNFLWGAATGSRSKVHGTQTATANLFGVASATHPKKIFDNSTSDSARDHHHCYHDDLALMRRVGFKAFRFSTSWTVVLPLGRGHLSPRGLDFYDRASLISATQNIENGPSSDEYTETGKEVSAPALRRTVVKVKSKHKVFPIYITVNGSAFKDEVSADEKVHGPRRRDYLKQHFTQIRLAVLDVVEVRGHMVWSLLDYFEAGQGGT